MRFFFHAALAGSALLGLTAVHADEGQWQPHQLMQLKAPLRALGIQLPAEQLADLSRAPMNAIISLGGCSASFVSPQGLVVTNHHCAYPAIQRNATAEKNLISQGFLARTLQEELPAGPNERIYVTDTLRDVTAEVTAGLDRPMPGAAREQLIAARIKKLIAECERSPDDRCTVPAFHRGMTYYLIRQMMIRDVRLVYAPSDKIGNFGGETDNFEWPRHTGDFAFLRAYVGRDGHPADPAPDNVPYQPKGFLSIAASGVRAGDPILLAGYPGRTSRYALPEEIRRMRDVVYPRGVADAQDDVRAIAEATRTQPEWQVRYASVVKGLQNRLKKTQGLVDGFARTDIAALRTRELDAFKTWLNAHPEYAGVLEALTEGVAEDRRLGEREFAYALASHADLYKAARTLVRVAEEKARPDEARESGFQARDWPFIRARLQRLQQSLVAEVDRARWQAALKRYRALPAEAQLPELAADLADDALLMQAHAGSGLSDTATRLAGLERDEAALHQDADPLIQLAVRWRATERALETARKTLDGEMALVFPRYMHAYTAWRASLGQPVYPDANSTLRVTYGRVAAYMPVDGVSKGPFTRVEGILAKAATGKKEYAIPEALRTAIRTRDYGTAYDAALGSVPVNFLSTADTTGGNSGSAVLNRKGELVGLNFDSTYESISKDWYFDPEQTRAIHVDIRYLLWVMEHVDHAQNVLNELRVLGPIERHSGRK